MREELQRAFLLTRFEQHLGGARVGPGGDERRVWTRPRAAGLRRGAGDGGLGFIWGAMYLWRRSTIAPIVSHGGFNWLEIVRYLVIGPGA